MANIPESITSGGSVKVVYVSWKDVDYFWVATREFTPDLAPHYMGSSSQFWNFEFQEK